MANPADRAEHLLANAPINASLAAKNRWLEELSREVRRAKAPSQRLLDLLDWLDRHPEAKARSARLIRAVLAESSALKLFSDTGIPTEQGVAGELLERFLTVALPEPRVDHDLSQLLTRLLPGERSVEWIESIPDELWARFLPWIDTGLAPGEAPPRLKLRRQMIESLLLLSAYLCSVGLTEMIRAHAALESVADSPFLRLHRDGERYVAAEGRSADEREAIARDLVADIADCREAVRRVFGHLEQSGVTFSMVYSLEKIEAHLARIQEILALDRLTGAAAHARAAGFLAKLLAGARHDRSFSFVLNESLRRMSRKIVERSGQVGDHYIAQNRAEYFRMLRDAAGGGALTAGTTLIKYALASIRFPLFFEAFFSSLNYAGSFCLMQVFGFKLATKQPSMTAAALASRIRETRNRHEFEEFLALVARITRSQFAAALGNLGAVIPVAWLIGFAWSRALGAPIFSEDTARHIVESLHPLKTLTLGYAALTGLLLWVSSAFASWVENWTVYRRLPEALARSPRLQNWLGEGGAARASGLFSRQISGTTSSVSLGVLLAWTPMAGKFFGLPLDVRHVTLSTGALTLAIVSAPGLPHNAIFWAAAGIVLIGLLNFGVSFVISLFFALRARGVSREWTWLLAKAVLLRGARKPLEFFFPLPGR